MSEIPWMFDVENVARTMADDDGFVYDDLPAEVQRQYRLLATKSLRWWKS